MNIHSLYRMARITDINRIERIKASTMKLVVSNGFGGASAAQIATDAKVAVGYFYMHYKGKYEMVNTLLQDVFQEAFYLLDDLLQGGSTFFDIISQLIEHIAIMANENPTKLKFLYVLTNDYSFVIDAEVKNKLFEFLQKLKTLGLSENAIDPLIQEQDLYLYLVVNPILHINHRFKFNPEKNTFSETEKDHVLYLIKKVLQQHNK